MLILFYSPLLTVPVSDSDGALIQHLYILTITRAVHL
jgi:hypothetical protein